MESTSPKSVRVDVLVSIVIAVILIVLAVVLFYYYQGLNHDLAVLSDVGQIRNALDLSAVTTTHYPIETEPVALNTVFPGTQKICSTGFASNLEACPSVLLSPIPQSDPGESYRYQSTSGGSDYSLEFTIRRNMPWLSLTKGVQCATRAGIRAGSCFAQ